MSYVGGLQKSQTEDGLPGYSRFSRGQARVCVRVIYNTTRSFDRYSKHTVDTFRSAVERTRLYTIAARITIGIIDVIARQPGSAMHRVRECDDYRQRRVVYHYARCTRWVRRSEGRPVSYSLKCFSRIETRRSHRET